MYTLNYTVEPVGASETTYPIFTGHTKTGLCGHGTTTRRCPCAQV